MHRLPLTVVVPHDVSTVVPDVPPDVAEPLDGARVARAVGGPPDERPGTREVVPAQRLASGREPVLEGHGFGVGVGRGGGLNDLHVAHPSPLSH